MGNDLNVIVHSHGGVINEVPERKCTKTSGSTQCSGSIRLDASTLSYEHFHFTPVRSRWSTVHWFYQYHEGKTSRGETISFLSISQLLNLLQNQQLGKATQIEIGTGHFFAGMFSNHAKSLISMVIFYNNHTLCHTVSIFHTESLSYNQMKLPLGKNV